MRTRLGPGPGVSTSETLADSSSLSLRRLPLFLFFELAVFRRGISGTEGVEVAVAGVESSAWSCERMRTRKSKGW